MYLGQSMPGPDLMYDGEPLGGRLLASTRTMRLAGGKMRDRP